MTEGAREGDILLGKYRVERVLGRGGMGYVVAARHVQLGTRVALKLLHAKSLENAQAKARFLREAQAAAKLQGEHVARVSDVGTLESGEPYLLMEYLEGRDLHAMLQDEGPLALRTAVDFAVQVCDALGEAHAAGIVHRDVKPSNLFVVRGKGGRSTVKVLDFGISKVEVPGETTPGELRMTDTATVMGSPVYMAPEQMRAARDADARSDVWSVGVTLYELLTGRLPFEATSMMDLCLKVANDAPPPLRELRPEVSGGLEAVVMRCLEKEPAARWTDAEALRTALEPFATGDGEAAAVVPLAMRDTARSDPGGTGSSATMPAWAAGLHTPPARVRVSAAPPDEPAAVRSTETSSPWSTGPEWARGRARRSKRLAWAGVGALLVGAGIAVVALRGSAPPAPAAPVVAASTTSVPPWPPATPSSTPELVASSVASAPPPVASVAASATAPGTAATPRRTPASVATQAPPLPPHPAPSTKPRPGDPFADPN